MPGHTYEELLLIIVVIPEKNKFFQSDLGLFRPGERRKTCAWFLTYFYMYLSLFFTECRLKFLSSLAKAKRDAPTSNSGEILILAYGTIILQFFYRDFNTKFGHAR